MNLLCVDPLRIDAIWPHVEPLLRGAYRKAATDDTLTGLHRDLRAGNALLWIVWSEPEQQILAAAATRLIRTGRGLICVIAALGGSGLIRWRKFLADIEAYARAERCTAMRVSGRRGWGKLLPGYHAPWVTLEKPLR